MSIEIERKFIVNFEKLTSLKNRSNIVQGYLTDNNKTSVRVRRINDRACLTIKSAENTLVRSEFEYSIALKDADYMLKNLCLNFLIEKTRYKINYCQHDWVIDKFKNNNQGLVLAEIELKSKSEKFKYPDWLLEEVTNISRYYNCNLAKHPFTSWAPD